MSDDVDAFGRALLMIALIKDYSGGQHIVEGQSIGDLLTDQDLDLLEKLAAAATAGPWQGFDAFTLHDETFVTRVGAPSKPYPDAVFAARPVGYENTDMVGRKEDWEFMFAAREALPTLVAEVRRLRAELQEAREELQSRRDAVWDE